ncbi:MAG: NADP-dependent isocitrate dehydrogenase, partial [Phycisphaerales bacterium]|nr:NADP-dependent isocitrate dehydrogenase [Phycisphaerales bacterium]
MSDEAVGVIEETGILYKGPMGTPIGGGGKSINVTLRKTFGAFANLRHFQTLPGVETVFSRAGVPVDFYVVRENVEDTYGGIEHRLTPDSYVAKRLITTPGCDQICKFAFETATAFGIDKVTCGHKANIMKMTDGTFLDRFRFISQDFPQIETEDCIIDAVCMNLVLRPDKYKMIVLTNLQGDIVSDLAAGLVGGLGFAPSANIGDQISIFEAVHGTAPDIANQDLANPTSLLLSGVIMLRHIGMRKSAAIIENSLLHTLESGVHTGDVKGDGEPVGTKAFADAIANNLGKSPTTIEGCTVPANDEPNHTPPVRPSVNEMMVTHEQVTSTVCGCDVFIETVLTPLDLAGKLQRICESTPFKLTVISNRGTQVWPTGSPYTELVNESCVRFELKEGTAIGQGPTVHLLAKVAEKFSITEFIPIKMYDGERGYSLAQGQ